ncbi:hypothetical protein HK405_004656, partial [Cladochytrium tenue]
MHLPRPESPVMPRSPASDVSAPAYFVRSWNASPSGPDFATGVPMRRKSSVNGNNRGGYQPARPAASGREGAPSLSSSWKREQWGGEQGRRGWVKSSAMERSASPGSPRGYSFSNHGYYMPVGYVPDDSFYPPGRAQDASRGSRGAQNRSSPAHLTVDEGTGAHTQEDAAVSPLTPSPDMNRDDDVSPLASPFIEDGSNEGPRPPFPARSSSNSSDNTGSRTSTRLGAPAILLTPAEPDAPGKLTGLTGLG